jgi:hypothetical protein
MKFAFCRRRGKRLTFSLKNLAERIRRGICVSLYNSDDNNKEISEPEDVVLNKKRQRDPSIEEIKLVGLF